MIIDKLIDKIKSTNNPSVVGIDTSFDYLPEDVKSKCKTLEDVAKQITDFNIKIIDSVKDIVPAVKVQVAYYEMYGTMGMKAFSDTVKYAKENGLFTISDIKRNDIGSTAGCYSKAYLSGVEINGKRFCEYESDFVTVNGYLGTDGIEPFVADCKKFDKGLFILVKTSNPSSGEFQNKEFKNNKTLYEEMAEHVKMWGKDLIGNYGYSNIGAVVGATHPLEAEKIRDAIPSVFFLVPGYGAQGGLAKDLAVCFDNNKLGAIVNSSRGILCAYKSEKYKGLSFADASRKACLDMQEDINKALDEKVKNL